jgi:hypothetical protein
VHKSPITDRIAVRLCINVFQDWAGMLKAIRFLPSEYTPNVWVALFADHMPLTLQSLAEPSVWCLFAELGRDAWSF